MTTTTEKKSSVQTALNDARQDVENASWPGLLGAVLNPVRDRLVAPAVGIASHVVPTVTSRIPFADGLTGGAIRLSCRTIKAVYGITPHNPSLQEEASNVLYVDALDTINDARLRRGVLRGWPRDLLSLLLTAAGFTLNTLLELINAPESSVLQWIETLEVFVAYLLRVGIVDELEKALLTPRLIENTFIIARVQRNLGMDSFARREKAAFPEDPLTDQQKRVIFLDSKRYVVNNHCTARQTE